MPQELERLYGGPLGFAAPCLVANFVETLDGVVAVPDLARSNALVADESDADRFVMALLRACADVVVVGSGTLLSSPQGTWRADRAYPPAADALAELRRARGLAEQPAVAVVTAGGSFDPTHPVLERGALVLTTEAAAPDLRASVSAATDVVAVSAGDRVDLAAAVAALREHGHRTILSEGGPNLFGGLLASRLVDELFLTVSPLLAGRASAPRLALVEGVELLPATRVAGRLLSARRGGEHLFLRYRL
ncbi:MAG TPA: dihydrofolate reductase family protein [Gaiellaceae bacterium]|nr:dihydrofolate reductase family protein [Gaiellaceae bacterium]